MKNKILVSKDVLMKKYLPIYNEKCSWRTPNIDELAKAGTIFLKHYTCAPSTAMSFTGMFLGKYPFQTNRKKYKEVKNETDSSLFDLLEKEDYECHIIWDKSYIDLAYKYSKCYGKNTVFHNVDFLTKKVEKHIKGKFDDLSYKNEFTEIAKIKFQELIDEICSKCKKRLFIWVHFPHVIAGRNSYGSDIDVFDQMIGIIRKKFDDDSIYITADHGHMNGIKGKYGYGFDLDENAIGIPLIIPRNSDKKYIEFCTSNIQLKNIILENCVEKLDFVISETAYYMQPHRKIAIIKDNIKLIYEKNSKKYFAYDLLFDKNEDINLYYPEIFDIDRKKYFSISQRIYYKEWENTKKVIEDLENEIRGIWKNGPIILEVYEKLKFQIKLQIVKLLNK